MVFGLDRLIDWSVEGTLRRAREKDFRRLLAGEFSEHLNYSLKLARIRPDDRTEGDKFFVDMLMRIYCVSQKCPSDLYFGVSKSLRREYNVIHRRIMEALSSCEVDVGFDA